MRKLCEARWLRRFRRLPWSPARPHLRSPRRLRPAPGSAARTAGATTATASRVPERSGTAPASTADAGAIERAARQRQTGLPRVPLRPRRPDERLAVRLGLQRVWRTKGVRVGNGSTPAPSAPRPSCRCPTSSKFRWASQAATPWSSPRLPYRPCAASTLLQRGKSSPPQDSSPDRHRRHRSELQFPRAGHEQHPRRRHASSARTGGEPVRRSATFTAEALQLVSPRTDSLSPI